MTLLRHTRGQSHQPSNEHATREQKIPRTSSADHTLTCRYSSSSSSVVPSTGPPLLRIGVRCPRSYPAAFPPAVATATSENQKEPSRGSGSTNTIGSPCLRLPSARVAALPNPGLMYARRLGRGDVLTSKLDLLTCLRSG